MHPPLGDRACLGAADVVDLLFLRVRYQVRFLTYATGAAAAPLVLHAQ
ncbi:MAG: hypothetical protein ACYCSX_13520 [Acidimicrobiales bacterium]